MADVVRSDLMGATILIPENFQWAGEGDLEAYRGADAVSRTLTWTEGSPGQPATFDAVDDIALRYYVSGTSTEITSASVSGWTYGDQNLSQIIYLSNFTRDTTADPVTGSVVINLDPSGLTSTELTAMLEVDVYVEATQPSPTD